MKILEGIPGPMIACLAVVVLSALVMVGAIIFGSKDPHI